LELEKACSPPPDQIDAICFNIERPDIIVLTLLSNRGQMRKSIFIIVLTLSVAGIIGVYAVPRNGLSSFERWKEMRTGRIYRSGSPLVRAIALTFDDGPDPRYTPQVLDILKAQGVKGTFFVCGNMLERHPELGRRIIAEGHVIGNHSMTHPHMERLRGAKARHEISDCERQIERLLGEKTYLFRPPRGLWNASEFGDASKSGNKMVLWSLAFDREAIHDSRALRKRVVRLAKPGDIILMHDGSYSVRDIRSGTIRELDQLIVGLRKRGFRFETVPHLLHIRGDERVAAGPDLESKVERVVQSNSGI
jgi:peptidoglycan/xylan/chitin deacetylase (PgdA/CDA1 family)